MIRLSFPHCWFPAVAVFAAVLQTSLAQIDLNVEDGTQLGKAFEMFQNSASIFVADVPGVSYVGEGLDSVPLQKLQIRNANVESVCEIFEKGLKDPGSVAIELKGNSIIVQRRRSEGRGGMAAFDISGYLKAVMRDKSLEDEAIVRLFDLIDVTYQKRANDIGEPRDRPKFDFFQEGQILIVRGPALAVDTAEKICNALGSRRANAGDDEQ